MPVLTRFGDGRSGIMYKHSRYVSFKDGTIDWSDERKTRSELFVGRCVIVRTFHDRYFAVGQRTVAALGELKPEIPSFKNGNKGEIHHKQYEVDEIPDLIIGESWEPALELAADSSYVDFAHVDWAKGHGSGAVVGLGEHNYFDPARKILAQFEPEALQTR